MKKIFALLLTCVMLMGLSITAYAGPSKEAEPEEPKPKPETVVVSPQTGDSELLVYSMMTASICAGVVAVSLRKVK